MNRFFAEDKQDNILFLDKDESCHLAMVLRMNKGDKAEVIYDGHLYLGEVAHKDKRQATISILEEKEVVCEPTVNITLFQGIPKGSKMDFVVQKCTELGVCRFVPVITKRCVAKASDSKIDRLNRIAYEACKQCKRVAVPTVEEVTPLESLDFESYDLVIVAYEDEGRFSLREVLNERGKVDKIGIVIGPEGGFEPEEIEMLKKNGVKRASLGKRILRSETAGVVCATAVLYHFGEMDI